MHLGIGGRIDLVNYCNRNAIPIQLSTTTTISSSFGNSSMPPLPSPSSLPSSRILAVDLSVWLMESQSIQRTFDSSSSSASSFANLPGKYHLQYIFQRCCAFLRHSIRLVFVSDGRPPRLKSRLQTKSNQVRSAQDLTGHKGGAPGGRIHAQVKECAKLLQFMDIPLLILDKGEAEALCGLLNARGSCDGVLTPDVDCFLFGGRTIMRNLEASQSSLKARLHDMCDVEATFGLDREKLILLALWLGSDYTSGVRGLGPRKAYKLLKLLEECMNQFVADESVSNSSSGTSRSVIRLFRSLIDDETSEAGIARIQRYHTGIAGSNIAPPLVPRSASSSSSSVAASAADAFCSPVTIDYSTFSLAELKMAMARHGLKPQTKANMVSWHE